MADAIILPSKLAEYVRSVSVRESEVLRRLREETEARPDASMLTSPEQAQFLALLARILGARRCLEIERVRDDDRVGSTLLPMRDGLTLALKR